MAANTHTPHYNLSQFGPDDRPSWIDDYNTDMRTIDTALTQGGPQHEPLFCTTKVTYGSNLNVSTETPYIADFRTHDGNIDVNYDTHTIPITKSGYYTVSGYTELVGLNFGSSTIKSLFLTICKYPESGSNENIVMCLANETNSEGVLQTCSITPVIVHLNAGEAITMTITTTSDSTVQGIIGTMYLTVESKILDGSAS